MERPGIREIHSRARDTQGQDRGLKSSFLGPSKGAWPCGPVGDSGLQNMGPCVSVDLSHPVCGYLLRLHLLIPTALHTGSLPQAHAEATVPIPVPLCPHSPGQAPHLPREPPQLPGLQRVEVQEGASAGSGSTFPTPL